MHSFIPTYERMGGFTESELSSEFEDSLDLIAPCLTPEFSRYYEKVKLSAEVEGSDIKKQKQFNEYCQELGFTPSQTDTLRTRHQIAQGLGANEHFLGNDLTRDINVSYDTTPFGDIDDNVEYGPPETFTWDKNPQTLGTLEKAGAIKRINIGKGKTNEAI
ncbi:hypothetical protein [Vibrio parahaemolyticus]|uniref:hypothetical protein n=1 Tax=Vibrio parahaemolyticus TaxID=670 RepID=UPI002B200434|nr:hypothetical protein [Vibrio parahaemolyticus]